MNNMETVMRRGIKRKKKKYILEKLQENKRNKIKSNNQSESRNNFT